MVPTFQPEQYPFLQKVIDHLFSHLVKVIFYSLRNRIKVISLDLEQVELKIQLYVQNLKLHGFQLIEKHNNYLLDMDRGIID